MRTFEGYVKFPNGRVQLMEVTAPDPMTARQMLQAYGECSGVAEKSKPVEW
jgi:hypothetical protein